MARRYAIASGANSPLKVQDLEDGCKWVDQYLSESNCSYMTAVENYQGGKSRFTYNISEINSKAHTFSRVLENVIVKKTTMSFVT